MQDQIHVQEKYLENPYPGNETCIRGSGPPNWELILLVLLAAVIICLCALSGTEAFSQARLPGADASDKLEAAGTLLRLIDTGLFKWGARIFAGLCIMSSAWALKEQRFGIAIICIVGAIIFGTAPTWVKNIFAIGGSDSVFGFVPYLVGVPKMLAHNLGIGGITPHA